MKAIKTFFGKAGNFVGETGAEMKKIAWPTRRELTESTVVVIATVMFLSVFVGVSDGILTKVLDVLMR